MAFEKVIGYEGIKKELRMLADILKNPQKYEKLGAKPPRGALFYGDPGLGKTLCAESFIKETGRHAVICRKDCGEGDFVKSINQAFDVALEKAPSILFFDDLDKASNNDAYHVNSEEFATMQTRIDALKDDDVFILATINSGSNLPNSLLRTGRFDRKFEFKVPSDKDSRAIMKRYMNGKNIEKGVEEDLFKMLSGHSCSDLETVLNSAAIFAGYDGRTLIDLEDAKKAVLSVLYSWNPFDNGVADREELEFQAFHEAGHVIVDEILCPGIVNLTAIRYDAATDGITVDNNKSIHVSNDKAAELVFTASLGGMAAIRTMFGHQITGVSSDLEHAYDSIRLLIEREAIYGFDVCNYGGGQSELAYTKIEDYTTAELNRYYRKAEEIVRENKESLIRVAEALIERRSLSSSEIQALMKEKIA